MDEAQRCFLQQGLNYSTAYICQLVAALPAPRFYINTFEALKQYNLYKRGLSKIRTNSRRLMYAEIFARYEHLVDITASTGQKVVKNDIMQRVLEQEAPSFYYNADSAIKMYYRIMQRKRKKHI